MRIALSLLLLLSACAARQASGPSPESVVATLGNQTVTERELAESTAEDVAKLDREYAKNRYDARKKGLEAIVFRKLVEAEAKRQGLTSEAFVEKEIESRLQVATPEEAKAFFEDNAARMGGAAFEDVKERIVDYLSAQRRSEVVLGLYSELKKKTEVKFALPPLRGERKDVGSDGESLGDKNAGVVIVEYSDFQCPYCSRAKKIVSDVLAAYPGKVRVVFRHFPLPFHENAVKAAEAAECAGAQKKFWEMHDHLFAHPGGLDVASLKEGAKTLGLDTAAFDACLDGGKSKAKVEADVARGKAFGIEGTPHFFVNGWELSGAQPFERFVELIDAELGAAKRQ
jgi:protein-disulfide isomerase